MRSLTSLKKLYQVRASLYEILLIDLVRRRSPEGFAAGSGVDTWDLGRLVNLARRRSGALCDSVARLVSFLLMAQDSTHILREIDDFLMGESKVHRTLSHIARLLDELGIDFALAGGVAVGLRGHLRVTVDVDLLITDEGLKRFKDLWLGRGYVEKFPGSKGLRDTETGVPIDFLIAGEFPGDGRPKPVRFPDPASIPQVDSPYRLLDLRTLVELKLASGLSAPDRLVDLADVLALIRANGLPETFADTLAPYVREKYLELWGAAQTSSDY